MAVFKAAATEQLKLLCLAFLLGNTHTFSLGALQPGPANACGTEHYVRAGRTQCFLLHTTYAAGMLLLAVIVKLNMAEAGASKGIASVAAGWRRAALRGTFLLAVGLSAASSFLAVANFEDGYRYRTGCAGAGMGGSRSPMAVVMAVFLALAHGGTAWVAAVSQN